jgi:exopolyphosphatase/guanosine-5'-triphosphate,3'-diphosphate pyrophosphatase
MRDVTAAQLMQRYHVDSAQAKRVGTLASELLHQVVSGERAEEAQPFLGWAAKLHEIGMTIAYSGYHKHSAYILRNADMPGFSRMEQERLALLVLSHRGHLRKLRDLNVSGDDWPLVAALRLAVLCNRSRTKIDLPAFKLKMSGSWFTLTVPGDWLAANPLTETALRNEMQQWRGSGGGLEIRISDGAASSDLPTAA